MDFSKLKPMPDRAILRINAKEREGIFNKKFKGDDGKMYSIIVTVDEQSGFDRKATLFVRTADVISVGRKVRNIQAGDIAILDYLVDNDENIVLGWENGDKYVSVKAVTTYHEKEVYAYANRQQKDAKDIRVAKVGSVKMVSQIIGCIRGEKFIANDPYVFIEYRKQGNKKTASGIEYKDTTPYAETKVLAVSQRSREEFGVEEGRNVFVKFDDLFDIELNEGMIAACNDEDVLLHI